MEDENLDIVLFILVFIFLFTVGFSCISHIGASNSGQHTGYITNVEQEGFIWKTWRAYVKTDLQSSQEDQYCVEDPQVAVHLKVAAEYRLPLTINYSSPWLVFKWDCGGESSIIRSILY